MESHPIDAFVVKHVECNLLRGRRDQKIDDVKLLPRLRGAIARRVNCVTQSAPLLFEPTIFICKHDIEPQLRDIFDHLLRNELLSSEVRPSTQ